MLYDQGDAKEQRKTFMPKPWALNPRREFPCFHVRTDDSFRSVAPASGSSDAGVSNMIIEA